MSKGKGDRGRKIRVVAKREKGAHEERRMVKKEIEQGYYCFDRCRRIREVATRSSLLTNFRCSVIAR